jgi:hypothetical protein
MLVARHPWVIGAVPERLREIPPWRFTVVPSIGAKTVMLKLVPGRYNA